MNYGRDWAILDKQDVEREMSNWKGRQEDLPEEFREKMELYTDNVAAAAFRELAEKFPEIVKKVLDEALASYKEKTDG